GDVVAASVAGSTSDIGNASLSIESRIVKLACKNGMRVAQAARYAHLGSKLETLPNGALSNRTKALQAASLSSELFDAIAYCFDEVRFKETVARMSANQKIACSPDQAKPVFEAIQVAVGLPDATKDAIFTHFCCERTPQGGNNYSKDGLVQAITAQGRAIATTVSYDKALPYEIMGGKLFEMPNEVFQELLPVAAASPKKAAKYFS
ncbi:MAG TPA: hypothetical protein VI728_07685, partial [Syntrophales bacterium]|nr:hypothetical protein [Syntrophales bacterium]